MERSTAPQQTFETLSGLRGAAAFCVLVYHIGCHLGHFEIAPQGTLAVDLFFCLSGFVLAHAYGRRLAGGMTVRDFMVARLQRLYPLILAAGLLGGSYAVLKAIMSPGSADLTAVGIGTLLALLVLPYPGAPEAIGGPLAFPINGPEWSLFFELFVNFAWVLAFKRLRMWVVWLVALVSAVAYDYGGDGGAKFPFFMLGFPRVTLSFALGLIAYDLFRTARLPRLALHPALVIAICALVLLRPGSPLDQWINPIFVILGGPLLILAGAQYTPSPRMVPALWLGGELSYPIYVLQMPVIDWVSGVMRIAKIVPPWPVQMAILAAAVVAASAIAAFAFDRPVRAYLAARRRRPARATAGAVAGP